MKLLQMSGITKRFYGVPVLDEVNFEMNMGEVHALLGENGAGKSTLMNILGGVYRRDSGSVTYCGRSLGNLSIKQSSELGIAFVHQELGVLGNLKVYENLFLNREIQGRLGRLDKKKMIERAKKLFERLGVEIDPEEIVDRLEPSRKQLLEIAKAFHADARLFILDEPTTALGQEETEHLFRLIRQMKQSGRSFIFISHKMPEVFQIADRYTVLRNGRQVASGAIEAADPEMITRQMVGESYANEALYEPRQTGEPVLELQNVSGPGFQNISFSVHRGEIVGLTGLMNAGASEVLQAVFGARSFWDGTMKVWGKAVTPGSIHRSMKNKIAMLAADRKENSILPEMTLLENTYLAEHCLSGRRQLINRRFELVKYHRFQEMLGIKAKSYDDTIVTLSGGNQQKVILGRWLNTNADILLLDNPTQGIDVGAKAEIYKLILELAKQGKTILINTMEIPEIQKIADWCAVFYHGEIQQILARAEITEERVMLLATNAGAIHTESGLEV